MDRPITGLVGLCLALIVFATHAAGQSGGSAGVNSGGASSHASGNTTENGAQGSVSSRQTIIPSSGRTAHRGGGAPAINCVFHAIDPLDPLGRTGTEVGPYDVEPGTGLWRTCYKVATGEVVSTSYYTATARPAGGGGPQLTTVLVDMALANIDIDLPEPRFSPPAVTLPNFDTWLWVNNLPTQSASATAGGITVTVTARVVTTKFTVLPAATTDSADDGDIISCTGMPPAYKPGVNDRDQPSTCHHRFAAPTRDFSIDTTTTWQLEWHATNGEGEDLGQLERTVATPYRVQAKATVIRTK